MAFAIEVSQRQGEMTSTVSEGVQKILSVDPDVYVTSFEDTISHEVIFVDITSRASLLSCGFAESFSEEVSLHKAYSEYVERRVFEKLASGLNLRTTSGMAAHPNSELALEYAAMEMVERDAFLLCWLGKRPPCWLSCEEVAALAGRTQLCLEGIRRQQMEPRIGIVALTGDVFTVCGALVGKNFSSPFGFVVTASADKTLRSCVEKTILTLMRYANMFVTRTRLGLPLLEVDCVGNRERINLHFNNSIDIASCTQSAWFFESSSDILVLPTFDIHFDELPVSFPLAFDRSVALARSADAQGLFFGATTADVVNRNRFHTVFGPETLFNNCAHPML